MPRRRTGTLVLRTRNGVPTWHAQVTVDEPSGPVRRWYSLETTDRAIAKRKLARLVRDLAAGTAPALAAETAHQASTLADYFTTWQTRYPVRSASDDRQRFDDYVPDEIQSMPLDAIRPAQIRDVINGVLERGRAPETARKVRVLLGRIFKRAWKDEIIPSNPVERTDNPKGGVRRRRAVMTDDELAAACRVESVPEKVRMIWVAQRFTGMRSGDACSWRWTDVHFERDEVDVPNEKTGEPRTIIMPAPFAVLLTAWWERSGRPLEGNVFPARGGGRYALRGTSFARQLRRALKLAGVTRRELFEPTERTSPVDDHSIRRLYCTALADAGTNQQTAMNLAGHTSASAHRRYLRLTDGMKRLPEGAIGAFSRGFDDGEPAELVVTCAESTATARCDSEFSAVVVAEFLSDFSGVDGTRTRGLRRDRVSDCLVLKAFADKGGSRGALDSAADPHGAAAARNESQQVQRRRSVVLAEIGALVAAAPDAANSLLAFAARGT